MEPKPGARGGGTDKLGEYAGRKPEQKLGERESQEVEIRKGVEKNRAEVRGGGTS